MASSSESPATQSLEQQDHHQSTRLDESNTTIPYSAQDPVWLNLQESKYESTSDSDNDSPDAATTTSTPLRRSSRTHQPLALRYSDTQVDDIVRTRIARSKRKERPVSSDINDNDFVAGYDESQQEQQQQPQQTHSEQMHRASSDTTAARRTQQNKRHKRSISLTHLTSVVSSAVILHSSEDSLTTALPTVQDIANHTTLHSRINLMNQPSWIQLCAHLLQKYAQASVSGDRKEQLSCLIALMQLPARALVKPRRGGKKRVNKTIRSNLRWILNHSEELRHKTPVTAVQRLAQQANSEAQHPNHGRQGDISEEEMQQLSDETQTRNAIRRCKEHVRSGHVHRAARDLSSTTSFADTTLPATIAALEELHPSLPSSSSTPPLPASSAPIIIDAADPLLRRVLERSDNGSAPGPSGWTGNMISCLLSDHTCVLGLVRLISDIINGNFDDSARDYILASRLVALVKPSGGIRPVAIGELFFRVAAKYMNDRMKKVASDLLAPHQYAVGESAGCERIVHSLRHHLSDVTNPMAVLKLDFKNAFNNIDRAAILHTLYNTPELSDLYRIANFAYAQPSLLLVSQDRNQATHTIHSKNGVKQGDPLSTLLFCLALHKVYDKIAASTNSHVYGFVDDINIVGTPERLINSLKLLKEDLPSLNLSINCGKSSFIYFHNDTAPLDANILHSLEQEGITAEYNNARILGVVIGRNIATEQQQLKETLKSNETFFDRLRSGHLPAQIAMLLLRSCGIPKLNYILRCASPATMRVYTEQFDNQIIETAASILGLTPMEIQSTDTPSNTRQKLQAPLKHGGWGLTPTTLKSPIAYLASLALTAAQRPTAAFQPYSQQTSQQHPPAILSTDTRLHQDLTDSVRLINEYLKSGRRQLQFTATDFFPYLRSHPLLASALQQNLIEMAQSAQLHAVLSFVMQNTSENKNDIAHLNCTMAPHAADWKTVVPTCDSLSLSTSYYQIAARLNLGLTPSFYLPSSCRLCNPESNSRLSTDPYHYLSCSSVKPREITQRHNSILRVLQRFFEYAGANTTIEPTSLGINRIRPDLQVILPGHHYLLDVCVTHPLCPSHISAAANRTLGATFSAEQAKSDKYRQLAINLQAEFIPFVIETLGGITKKGEKVLDNIILACSEYQSLWSPAELRKELLGAIAVAVQRGNGMAITAGHHWSVISNKQTINTHSRQPFIHPQRLANIRTA